jgi:uroporphyrinogen-III synthase
MLEMDFHLNQAASPARTPLTGKGIVITRPEMQAGPLAAQLAALGARPIIFPAVVIQALPEQAPIAATMSQLADFDAVIFASANAVIHSLPHWQQAWPSSVMPFAVGPGTAAVLAQYGVARALTPASQFDSEGLLALPELQEVAGKRILLIRGQGGRLSLAQTLTQRGASITLLDCYRRSCPSTGALGLLEAWQEGRIDAILLTSSEGASNLLQILPSKALAYLKSTPIFVPHPKVLAHCQNLGLSQLHLTAGGEQGLLNGLITFWSKP